MNELLSKFNAKERVLLVTGHPNSSLVVAEGSLGDAGPQLTFAFSWETGAKTEPRDRLWWDSLTQRLSELQSTPSPCQPQLNVTDSEVVYLRVSRPAGEFELITYGVLPRFPESATEGANISRCQRALMNVMRLLEEPMIKSLEDKFLPAQPGFQ